MQLPKICTTNVRSINNKIETINGFIIDSNLDIISLIETWANNDSDSINHNKLDLNPHYYVHSVLRYKSNTISQIQSSKNGGGITTIISTKYSKKPPTPIHLPVYNPTTQHFEIQPIDQMLELSILRAYPK